MGRHANARRGRPPRRAAALCLHMAANHIHPASIGRFAPPAPAPPPSPPATLAPIPSDPPSATPLARKLGIAPGQAVAFLHAPPDWAIRDLPEPLTVRRQARGHLDLIVAFFRARRELEQRIPTLARNLDDDAALWIAWPRRAGGHQSDITENALREVVLPTGLVDVKVAALTDDWSGLKFVRRRALRGR